MFGMRVKGQVEGYRSVVRGRVRCKVTGRDRLRVKVSSKGQVKG